MGWLTHKCSPIFNNPTTERKKRKMKIEELITLTQAGFTKDEILIMTQQPQQTQQAQQTQQSQQPQQIQQTQQAQQNDGLLAAITNLTNTIQASNITGSGLQTLKKQPETADQIAKRMMEIMN